MQSQIVSRREFAALAPAAVGVSMALGPAWMGHARAATSDSEQESRSAGGADSRIPKDFPAQSAGEVREVVGKSHFDVARVKELVQRRPALAKAVWDWGFGDWESALGAASHMGRRDIAEVLLAHGARPDVFTFATLGYVDVLKQIVAARPGIQRLPGPHGLNLLEHAKNAHSQSGDASSKNTLDFVQTLDGANERCTDLAVTENEKTIYLGTYRFGSEPDEYLEVVTARDGKLALRRGEQVIRRLHRVAGHTFAPSGAADVRIIFEVVNGAGSTLSVHDPMPIVKAIRQ